MLVLATTLLISAKPGPDCFFHNETITDITVNGRSSPHNMSGYYPVSSAENIDSAKRCQEIRISNALLSRCALTLD